MEILQQNELRVFVSFVEYSGIEDKTFVFVEAGVTDCYFLCKTLLVKRNKREQVLSGDCVQKHIYLLV